MQPSWDAYNAAGHAVALLDHSARDRLAIRGPDRVKFLHNVTTQDIKALAPGRGCEAFITSLQGKTLAYVTILAAADHHLLRADRASLPAVLPHLQKYGVFDDVALDLEGPGQSVEFHLAGPGAEQLLSALGCPAPDGPALSHDSWEFEGHAVRIVREAPTGRPGWTLIAPASAGNRLHEWLAQEGAALGLRVADPLTAEVLRIEAGTPRFGSDVMPENLPQEIGRDTQAISFTKGCYLGQETVARLDALGHVNRRLTGLILEHPVAVGASLTDETGKPAGHITSIGYSPGWGRHVALGIVRVAHAQSGHALRAMAEPEPVDAVVHDLPMLPG